VFKITIARHGQVPTLVGIVDNLSQARDTVKLLDLLFERKTLPEEISWYNDETEVWADDLESGQKYNYMDQDPSGASDGIWDLA